MIIGAAFFVDKFIHNIEQKRNTVKKDKVCFMDDHAFAFLTNQNKSSNSGS